MALLLLSATCVHSQDIIQAVSPDGQVSFDRLVTEDFGCDITSSKAEYSYVSVQLDASQSYFRGKYLTPLTTRLCHHCMHVETDGRYDLRAHLPLSVSGPLSSL